MEPRSSKFKEQATAALGNRQLQAAMSALPSGLVANRRKAVAAFPGFEALRDQGTRIRDETLADLDLYLSAFEERAVAAGSKVHWADDASAACVIIAEICRGAGAKLVAKGKSMISEEIGLNGHLEGQGFKVVETDLGEYIVQRRGETPSHIIAPAIHVTEPEIAADFRRWHTHLPAGRQFPDAQSMVSEARTILRETFLTADAGITGANFLVAETGSAIVVTNEGNGDLTATLPKAHIVLASIEKVVPTLDDAAVLLRLLARSATGQEMTAYTSVFTGPRRSDDQDGPQAMHIVILDNGRTGMLGSDMQAALRCIRCGACMNHCPVYNAVGGHAYGWVYPGPIGAVLTPALIGLAESHVLPEASTFCGSCESVCPVRIPLVSLMRTWRERHHAGGGGTWFQRTALSFWAFTARRPWLYHRLTGVTVPVLTWLAGRRGRLSYLPFASAWTRHRDLPAPEGATFQQQWTRRKGRAGS